MVHIHISFELEMVEVRFMLCYYTVTGRRLQKGLLAIANFCNGNLLCEVKLLKDYSTSFAIGPFIYMYHIPHIFMTFFLPEIAIGNR